jgi:hypothetical protein
MEWCQRCHRLQLDDHFAGDEQVEARLADQVSLAICLGLGLFRLRRKVVSLTHHGSFSLFSALSSNGCATRLTP